MNQLSFQFQNQNSLLLFLLWWFAIICLVLEIRVRGLTVLYDPHEIELLFRLVRFRLECVFALVFWAHKALYKLLKERHFNFVIIFWKEQQLDILKEE